MPDSPAPIPCAPPRSATEGEEPERRMSLGDHLAELRARLGICVLALLAAFILGGFFYSQLWTLVRLPVCWAATALGKKPEELVSFIWLSPLGGFTAIARVDLILSLLLVLPLLVYEAWCFVAPGLTRRERGLIFSIFTAGSGLFVLGAVVAFLFGVPLALVWLLSFNLSLEGSLNQWTLDEYLSFLTMVAVGFGLAFETPLVMLALAKAGLIRPEGVRRYWRHTLLLIVVLAAIFTPPDPFTQIILASLLTVLYAIGYLLVRWAAPRRTEASDG
jgi:sec-independent protein translocase protein TatC